MRALEQAGLAGLAEPPPPLSPAAELALECWGFCAGWAPERWPVFDALHPVPDWHHLIELLRVMRQTLREIDTVKT